MKLIDIFVNLIIRLLYLTPIGLYISLFYLALGKRLPGIFIKDGLVFVKENPTIGDRVSWFVNGIFILNEGWYFLKIFNYDTDAVIQSLFLFGLTAIIAFVSCFYPRFHWNKPISTLSGIIILLIFSILSFLVVNFIVLLLNRF